MTVIIYKGRNYLISENVTGRVNIDVAVLVEKFFVFELFKLTEHGAV